MKTIFFDRVREVAKSRVVLVLWVALVLLVVGQAAALGLTELRYKDQGPALAALETAKAQLLAAVFPVHTSRYLVTFPLFLLATLMTCLMLIPVILVAAGAVSARAVESEQKGEGVLPRASIVADFCALWVTGVVIATSSSVAACLVAKALSVPLRGAVVIGQLAVVSLVVASSILPTVGALTALRVAFRGPLVFAFGSAFVLLKFVVGRMKSAPAWIAWLSPRTYENYVMATGYTRLLGVAVLMVWGIAGLALAHFIVSGGWRTHSGGWRILRVWTGSKGEGIHGR